MMETDDFLENAPPHMRASFRDQLERAVLSVSNNIAEGFERGTTNELLAIHLHRARFGGRSPLHADVPAPPQMGRPFEI